MVPVRDNLLLHQSQKVTDALRARTGAHVAPQPGPGRTRSTAGKQTVSPADAMEMIGLTPTARLEWLLGQQRFADAHAKIRELLAQYETFLAVTNADEQDLVRSFMDKGTKPGSHERCIQVWRSRFRRIKRALLMSV